MNRLIHLLLSLFIVMFSIAIYSNTLKNGFVFDDEFTVVNNTLIKDLNNLPILFKKEYFLRSGETSYRPVVTFTYFLDYAIYALKPWGFHLTNILLHAINSILLYLFLMLLFKPLESSRSQIPTDSSRPLIITLLFTAQPILTEAVNAVSFREDLLAFLFYIATLNLYLFLRPRFSRRLSTDKRYIILYLISCLLYFLALLSKEMAVTLPLVIYCYELSYVDKGKERFNSIHYYNIGYIAVTIAYIFLRFYYFQNPETQEDSVNWDITTKFLTVPWLLISYIKLTLFPTSLSADYVIVPVKSALSSSFIGPTFAVISLIVIAIMQKKRGVTFGILFFLASLVPVYNLIPIANPLAERYLYLPMAGFVIAIGSAIPYPRVKRLILLITLFTVLSLYSLIVIKRNGIWRDDRSLWSDTIRKISGSSRAHNNLGNAYLSEGKFKEAVTHLQAALKLKPDDPKAHYNLGLVYYKTGLLDKAVGEFQSALWLKPDDADSYNYLGIAYAKHGKLNEAIQKFMTALRLNPYHTDAHTNLGVAYYRTGQFDKAMQEYILVLNLNPDSIEAHFNLGNLYLTMNMERKAKEEFKIVLILEPNHSPAKKALNVLEE